MALTAHLKLAMAVGTSPQLMQVLKCFHTLHGMLSSENSEKLAHMIKSDVTKALTRTKDLMAKNHEERNLHYMKTRCNLGAFNISKF